MFISVQLHCVLSLHFGSYVLRLDIIGDILIEFEKISAQFYYNLMLIYCLRIILLYFATNFLLF
jgi:hypothetical protein